MVLSLAQNVPIIQLHQVVQRLPEDSETLAWGQTDGHAQAPDAAQWGKGDTHGSLEMCQVHGALLEVHALAAAGGAIDAAAPSGVSEILVASELVQGQSVQPWQWAGIVGANGVADGAVRG